MIQESVPYKNGVAEGYVIPLGPANLVVVVTKRGMIGCGAFDVEALDKFEYPAARVKPTRGSSIANVEDLLAGEIKDANSAAEKLGVRAGMSGKDGLDLL
ncbi:MAG TPA: YunC family protein [Methanothrix sp.]|nr:YunC family protein [Methanothrix sp.]HPJ83837.1 YunC family protein [Methanothrix sp.]HPR65922.1 YunC family protein [Methanothrix sp.]